MNEYIKAIQMLANGEQPGTDIYDMLYSHNSVSYTHLTLPTKRIV